MRGIVTAIIAIFLFLISAAFGGVAAGGVGAAGPLITGGASRPADYKKIQDSVYAKYRHLIPRGKNVL
jgi:hypothetical protein